MCIIIYYTGIKQERNTRVYAEKDFPLTRGHAVENVQSEISKRDSRPYLIPVVSIAESDRETNGCRLGKKTRIFYTKTSGESRRDDETCGL